MRFTIVISVLLHVAAFAVGYLAMPDFRRELIIEPIVPVEILREADLAEETSVPETTTEPEEEPEPVEPEPEPEPVQPEPEPEQVEPEPVPELDPEPEEPEEIEPEPEPEPEPPAPEPEPEPPEEDNLDFDDLESALENLDPDEDTSAPRETLEEGDRDQERVGLGDQLTVNEMTAMLGAMLRCWNFDAGVPDAETLVVRVEFNLNRDGSIKGNPRVLNEGQISASGNPFWKVAERNAVNAVVKCAPYDFLAQERYEEWEEIQLNFDPRIMAGL